MRRGQLWLTNYYGRTLGSLGEIVSVQIEQSPSAASSATNRQHSEVWKIIGQAKIQDYVSVSMELGMPPKFSIEFADGLRVYGSRSTAGILLTNGVGRSLRL